MNVEQYLKEYKSITEELINQINGYGNVRELFERREEILNELNNGNFSRDEIRRIGNELKLIELEENMRACYNLEKANIMRKIQNLRKMQHANEQYMALGYISSNFNKSI